MKDLGTMENVETLSMSNFDHTIDDGLPELLKENEGKSYAKYYGWNFFGEVWYENKKFTCQVWVYSVPRGEIEAETLEEIMELVRDKYGYN